MLLVGAVDVLSGDFRACNSRHEQISVDMILASAAILTLFRAVQFGGGTFWDGLFSQNPPIRELIEARRRSAISSAVLGSASRCLGLTWMTQISSGTAAKLNRDRPSSAT